MEQKPAESELLKMNKSEIKLSDRPSLSRLRRQIIINRTHGLVSRLTNLQTHKGRQAQIAELEIRNLCLLLPEVLSEEPSCLSLDLTCPLNVVGDIYGHFTELLQILAQLGHPPHVRYLFLGNFVGRGERSIETIALLFAYKLLYPKSIYLLRGNHESDRLGRLYGFYDELRDRFSHRLWASLMNAFNYLPVCAIIENVIFCSHSGISPCVHYSHCKSTKELESYINRWILRPSDVEANLLLTHFLWSEPDSETVGWTRNPCGLGYLFGPDEVRSFCDRFGFSLMIRSNNLVSGGFEFFADNRLISIFTAPGYLKTYKNEAAIVNLVLYEKCNSIVCHIYSLKPTVNLSGTKSGRTTLIVSEAPTSDPSNLRLFQDDDLGEHFYHNLPV
ncbi:Serine/threonine-protein phosphatase [Fasciolopsis buskii]|uniref:Serine/threonine-protein phosphatase n=1 Tax=Fasciolopsis buskii TaxID=27845 RepID=A0A8E0VF07_9TREM|nr:Serine/threonine-protein phosphatase [Fasciolopsis buski]